MGLLQVREAWQVVNLGKRLAPPPCDKENEKSPYRKGRLNSTHGSMEPLEVSVSNLTPKAFLLSIASWSKWPTRPGLLLPSRPPRRFAMPPFSFEKQDRSTPIFRDLPARLSTPLVFTPTGGRAPSNGESLAGEARRFFMCSPVPHRSKIFNWLLSTSNSANEVKSFGNFCSHMIVKMQAFNNRITVELARIFFSPYQTFIYLVWSDGNFIVQFECR